jgi:predicted small metal-binding protein
MRILTCRELGGACHQKISANSWDEMVQKMTKHVMDSWSGSTSFTILETKSPQPLTRMGANYSDKN